jgi:hypothetical protein
MENMTRRKGKRKRRRRRRIVHMMIGSDGDNYITSENRAIRSIQCQLIIAS